VDALMRLSELGSGFSLAAMDLEIRGAGDLLGAKQSGNIRKVGFELYCEMLEEAAATLRGEAYAPDIEPEIKMNVSAYIPESYVEDAGLRLSFYKRMASATAEGQVWDIVDEIADRFGELPAEVKTLRELMIIKVLLRRLGAYGIEAGPRRVLIHLSDRTPIDPQKIIRFVEKRRDGRDYRMAPEGKLALTVSKQRNPISLTREFLDEILDLAG
jgi:transcription-repair coupling factor (superfamily II helicase)